MDFPQDLRYTKDHEWARNNGGMITMGITAFAVEQLGDITQVDLPKVGATVTAGKAMGTIESVKSVSDVYAPVTGTITKVNGDLESSPEKVNEDPYAKGWLVEIKANGDEFSKLMDVKAYTEMVKAGGH